MNFTKEEIREELINKVSRYFAVSPGEATEEQMYRATVLSVRDILAEKDRKYQNSIKKKAAKRVYYLCMEYLIGPSLKNNLFNLELTDLYREVISEMGFSLDKICAMEQDPGLGNGGLGRLAACYMDSLATLGYPARGYSICYEYGLFKQKIVDGEQLELPDIWLPNGEVWLVPREDKAVRVRLGGKVDEVWNNNHLDIVHTEYDEIEAVPYDMFISGYRSEAVTPLRLWKAKGVNDFNMEAFSQGQYLKAVEENTIAETITRVLYPADNHHEGKLLRLSQQYFLVSASLQNILAKHIQNYKTLDNFSDKVAVHINDTHPALAIPELMRLLMDMHNYNWEEAWDITVKTVSYTNHTVLPEAMECWNDNLFRIKLPRIYTIIKEINRRFCTEAWDKFPGSWDKVSRMAVLSHGLVKMANLSVIGSHSVNGVSKLHSDILKNHVFNDFDDIYPGRL
ncbi:MAG: glycogen/starch/alpha-glucan family phosphorylase, partial [Victivallales bacterium]